MFQQKTGVWIIGAGGGVATTLIVGANAIISNLTSNVGLVTEMRDFQPLGLIPLEDIVFGGYEIRKESIYENAVDIHKRTGTFPHPMLEKIRPTLDIINDDIIAGITFDCGSTIKDLINEELPKDALTLREAISSIKEDLNLFKQKHSLKNLIVLNLASTEQYIEEHFNSPATESLEILEKYLDENRKNVIPVSTIYAYAAMEFGCPYINFTPSLASTSIAMQEFAEKQKIPHIGKDGKTGETLIKSTLAPMFLARNLHILSWAGYNILGDRDGQVLNDPKSRETKIKSKDATLNNVLGYKPFTHTGIDYIPSLDDWKTAWDHIHFEGFLGTKMVMQFIWQGCDAILAAPIALDLVRFAEFAHRKGEYGLMKHLACFFKSPINVDEYAFPKQIQMLMDYVKRAESL